MSASQNNLLLILQQLDAAGVPVLNRQVGPIEYAGTVGEPEIGTLTDTNAHAQTLPTTNLLQLYFKNTHATAVITLTATPQGGASAVIAKVQPGGVFVNWCASTSATAGYTALSLQSDTANATFEMFLGG